MEQESHLAGGVVLVGYNGGDVGRGDAVKRDEEGKLVDGHVLQHALAENRGETKDKERERVREKERERKQTRKRRYTNEVERERASMYA